MSYACGNCGSAAPGRDGCPRCNGPTFDLDAPAGVRDMKDYREMCRDREDEMMWTALWLLPFVVLPILARVVIAQLGGDPVADLPRWVEGLVWAVTVGLMALAFAVRRRLRPPALRAIDDRLYVGCMEPPALGPAATPKPASPHASSAAR